MYFERVLSEDERRSVYNIPYLSSYKFDAACSAVGAKSLDDLRQWIIANQPYSYSRLWRLCAKYSNFGKGSAQKIIAWADRTFDHRAAEISTLKVREARLRQEIADVEARLKELE